MTKTSLLLIPAIAILAGCATPANQRKLYEVDSINTSEKHARTIVYPAEYKAPPVDATVVIPGLPTPVPPSMFDAPPAPGLPMAPDAPAAPGALVPAEPAADAAPQAVE